MFDLTDSQNPILQPELSHWRCEPWRPTNTELQQLRQSARRSLVTAALRYTSALPWHSDSSADWLTGDPDNCPVVLTGHQPVVFHPGLAFKYQVTEQFAASIGAIAVAVQIDTDEGDAGQFPVPAAVDEETVADGGLWPALTQRRATWTAAAGGAPGLLGTGQLGSVEQRRLTAQQVQRWLTTAGCRSAATSFECVAGWYRQLPESGMSGQQHGIRNAANPFPDLHRAAGVDGERYELPLWLVDLPGGQRRVVWLWHRDGQRWLGTESGVEVELCAGLEAESLLSLRWKGQQLVPRGGLISALLRLLFADLFVHGLGGGKYDPAVDELIRVWWGEHPPGFAVASASRYLFGEQRAELLRLREFAGRQRELQYNPDRFLGQSIFTEQAEQRLRTLLAEKEVLVSELQRRRSAGMSAAEIGTQLQRLTERLRETAGADLQPQLQVLQQLSDETLQQLENRQWPWYYFLPPPPPPLP